MRLVVIARNVIGVYERTPAKPPSRSWQRVQVLVSGDETHTNAEHVEWLRTLPTSELKKFG